MEQSNTNKVIRSVSDIRTLTGRAHSSNIPYMRFMKLSCLEMEKLRRGKERASAMHRVNAIDARFREIEIEKASLLEEIQTDDVVIQNQSSDTGKSKSGGNTSRFRIRY